MGMGTSEANYFAIEGAPVNTSFTCQGKPCQGIPFSAWHSQCALVQLPS